jgi:group I intron endonuclease
VGRWNEYKSFRCKKQLKLFRALKKYGFENFETKIIEECEPVDWILDYREMYWINILNSMDGGYNCTGGGKSGKLCKETRKKISDWNSDPINKKMISEKVSAYFNNHGHNSVGTKHTTAAKLKMASHDRSGNKCPSFGKIWINNGIESKKIPNDQNMPDGFMRGRLMGTIIVNNGTERKFIKKDAPIPIGFVYGNLYKRKNRLCK